MNGIGKILKQFSVNTGIQQKEVAEKVGFSSSRVNNYFRDIADPPFEFYQKFRNAFNVDLKVLVDRESKGIQDGAAAYNPLPVYDLDLKPVKQLDFFNHSELISYYMDTPLYNDCFAFVRVSGSDMAPDFNPTDVIAIKKILDFENIPFGAAYLIITEEQRLLRYIRLNEDKPKDNFLLRSNNPNFDDMTMKKSAIKFLFQIRGKLVKF